MNQLEQLKQFTTVVADTGNFKQLAQFAPRDATTNPSLILKAVQQPEYAPLLADTVAAHAGQPLDAIVDQVLVRFGREILKIVPGRVSTEVDARLSFDTAATAARAERRQRQGMRCKLTLLFVFCQVMSASVRNTGQFVALAACELLTIAPELLVQLQASEEPAQPVRGTGSARPLREPPRGQASSPSLGAEGSFRWALNQVAMATEKLAKGIRAFAVDAGKLDALILGLQR
jgi:transaldolase